MPVVKNNNDRSTEYIKRKVSEAGGFREYVNSLKATTIRNYKKNLVSYVKQYENSNKELLDLINCSIVEKSNSNIKEHLDSILNRIDENSKDSNIISISEDVKFLVCIALIDETNKDKMQLTKDDVQAIETEKNIKILLHGKQKYILTSYVNLFTKAFKTITEKNSDFLFKNVVFPKLIENQFLQNGIVYDKDFKNIKNIVRIHMVKRTVE